MRHLHFLYTAFLADKPPSLLSTIYYTTKADFVKGEISKESFFHNGFDKNRLLLAITARGNLFQNLYLFI